MSERGTTVTHLSLDARLLYTAAVEHLNSSRKQRISTNKRLKDGGMLQEQETANQPQLDSSYTGFGSLTDLVDEDLLHDGQNCSAGHLGVEEVVEEVPGGAVHQGAERRQLHEAGQIEFLLCTSKRNKATTKSVWQSQDFTVESKLCISPVSGRW